MGYKLFKWEWKFIFFFDEKQLMEFRWVSIFLSYFSCICFTLSFPLKCSFIFAFCIRIRTRIPIPLMEYPEFRFGSRLYPLASIIIIVIMVIMVIINGGSALWD